MSSKLYKVPEDFAALAHLKHADYLRLYQESVRDPHTFWSRIGRRLDWIHPYSKVKDTSYDEKDFRIRWFYDGKLNVAANCLDRHLTKRGDKTAILWESDDPRLSERITYRQLVRARVSVRQCAQSSRCAQGRSRHDLHADDSRDCSGDARVCAHRRRALGRVRRLLARIARRSHRGLQLQCRDHCR
jgi:hypothetical protein